MKFSVSRHARRTGALGLAVALSACNLNSSVLSVSSSDPAQNATNVPRTVQPSVTFSQDMNPNSVNTSNVEILGPLGNVIASTPTTKGPVISATATAGKLPGNTTITFRMLGSETSTDGFILNQVYDVVFTTASSAWQSSVTPVATATSGTLQNPLMVTDSNGNIAAFWIQNSSGSTTTLYTARYTNSSSTWSAATALESSTSTQTSAGPAAAVDANGNVTVVWVKNDTAATTLDSFVYTNSSSTWSGAQPVIASLSSTGTIQNPAVVVDPNGVVTAAWVQNNGTRNVLNSNRYSSGAWGSTATQVDSSTATGAVSSPNLAVDTSGNVTAVWVQVLNNATRTILNSSRYSSSWSSPVEVDSSSATGGVSSPVIGIDKSGAVMAAWLQSNGTRNILNASRYSAGAWATPAEVDSSTATSGATAPVLAEDAAGNVTVAWFQFNGVNAVFANRYTASTGLWGTAPTAVSNSGNAQNPAIVIDVAGNVTLSWVQAGSTYASTYFISTTTWSTPLSLGLADDNNTPTPALAVDGAGDVTALWISGSDASLSANRLQ